MKKEEAKALLTEFEFDFDESLKKDELIEVLKEGIEEKLQELETDYPEEATVEDLVAILKEKLGTAEKVKEEKTSSPEVKQASLIDCFNQLAGIKKE